MSGVLAETVETGTKDRCVIEATHVLRKKLRKGVLRKLRPSKTKT